MINLLFDYDGTVNDPVGIFAPCFRETVGRYIEEKCGVDRNSWTDDHVASWFGVSLAIMYDQLSPYASEEELKPVIAEMSTAVRFRMSHCADPERDLLFDGAPAMLRELRSRGYHLILFSKCDRPHIERQRRNLPLDELFDELLCTGDFGDMNEDKAKLFPGIRERFPGDYIVIGDRKQDVDIALTWGLECIGCAYGYGAGGELDGASEVAHSAGEIPALIDKIVNKKGW